MGFHTLIEINHDTFSEVDRNALHADLLRYVASGDADQARRIEDEHGVRVISMRHSGDRHYVSERVDGFPTQLPYDEELDRRNRTWAAAVEKARALLGGAVRVRTMAEMRDLVAHLLERDDERGTRA